MLLLGTNLAYFFISQTPIYRCLGEVIKKAMLNLQKNKILGVK